MNVPQNLIDAIERGECTYQTAALGAAGHNTIPVPEGKYIVIFGFTFNHFYNMEPGDGNIDRLDYVLHHLQFQSRQQRFLYNFRTILRDLVVPFGATPITFLIPSNGAENIPCYQIHRSDVNISIWNAPPVKDWTFIYATIPGGKTTIESPVLGYGTATTGGANTLYDLVVDPVNNPTFRTNPPSARNLPSGGARFEFSSPITKFTALEKPLDSTEDALYMVPLVNVYYCLFNKPTSKHDRL